MPASPRSLCASIALLSILCLAACGGDAQPGPGTSPTGSTVNGPTALPALPAERAGAGLTEYLINGVAVFEKSSGALENGTALELGATAGFQWAIYAFAPAGNQPDSLHVLFDAPSGGVWIGLADYSAGRWDFAGPHDKGRTLPLDGERQLSPLGNIYILVAAAGGSPATVNALSVRTINPNNAAPQAQLTTGPGEAAGSAPHAVSFDASASTDEGGISHYLWDYDGDGGFDNFSFSPASQHTYHVQGSYMATVSAVDSEGAHDEASTLITVNAPPIAVLDVDRETADKNEIFLFDAAASFDPDGAIEAIAWDFDGDGLFAEEGEEEESSGQMQAGLSWGSPGPRTVSARVTDDSGASATAALAVTVSGWVRLVVDDLQSNGQFVSLAEIDGRPAISYRSDAGLAYACSATDSGAQIADWATVSVDAAGQVLDTSLIEIDGRPAVAYLDVNPAELRYARSVTASGSSEADWTHVLVKTTSGPVTGFVSLAQVAGHPAIGLNERSFLDDDSVSYARSATADGLDAADWSSVLVDQSTDSEADISLALVDGHPALAYSMGGSLLYVRSSTPEGMLAGDWNGKVDITAAGESAFASLLFSAGRPLIACHRNSGSPRPLQFAHSLTADGGLGADWSVLNADAGSFTGLYCSMNLLSALPAIAYLDANSGLLKLARSATASGGDAALWERSVADPATGLDIRSISLAQIAGRPAIAYEDHIGNTVRYAVLF